ncbi:hypothetical protein LR48_Vigan07g133700 [Vigna angularis]|uniref:Uncharacterized protein n=1 Tax=Phaseolus angularis TaxID=3914 RepID=A0A0L9UXY2_PHAAN|nr:hypothetical protein LR48_Vigan07g133700 [Vigna angularis]
MESERNSKSSKEEKPQVPLSASLPLSDTKEHPLAPLRGESAAEGRIDYALVPLNGGILGLGEVHGLHVQAGCTQFTGPASFEEASSIQQGEPPKELGRCHGLQHFTPMEVAAWASTAVAANTRPLTKGPPHVLFILWVQLRKERRGNEVGGSEFY